MNPTKNQTVTIKKIVNNGYGLSHTEDGRTLMVRHALPEETVTVQMNEGRRVVYGKIISISNPNEGRIEPPCPYYHSCGGCDLQHASYDTQCVIKTEIVKDLFLRNGSDELRQIVSRISPIMPSPLEFGYRQRIRLRYCGGNRLGFRRFKSHDVIPISHCLLAPELINLSVEILTESSSLALMGNILEEIDLLYDPNGECLCLIFNLSRKPRPAERAAARDLCKRLGMDSRLFFKGADFALEGPFPQENSADRFLSMSFEIPKAYTLFWEAGGFCQVNQVQNKQLIKLVLDYCAPSPTDTILDLYCGMGNFSLPLAQISANVHAIESQGSAIRSGKKNGEYNRIGNVHFEKSDVKSGCQRLIEHRQQFDIIVCDPPRQGMADMAKVLRALCRKKLVYISCDPATLVRDLANLVDEGFSIQKVQPVDMFPQTHHIETVVLLER